jgi:hypothetical protein
MKFLFIQTITFLTILYSGIISSSLSKKETLVVIGFEHETIEYDFQTEDDSDPGIDVVEINAKFSSCFINNKYYIKNLCNSRIFRDNKQIRAPPISSI